MIVTIKDVAKLAGVSISTVSRVLNNSKPVSSEIRERVEKVIAETGYVPNPVARSLVMRRSQFIGVIVPNISNSKIGEYLNGIEEIGRMYEYDLLLCNSYGEVEEEIKYIELLRSKQVAGIIFITWKLEPKIVQLIEESRIPTVFISKNADEYDVISVGVDYFGAAYDVTQYLIDAGHKKIAFFRTSIEDHIHSSTIFRGYSKALRDNGIDVDMDMVLQGDSSGECGYSLMEKLLKSNHCPTAVFSSSDEAAIGAIGAICDNGLSVPEDISVAGFSDMEISSLIRPALTTVHHPLYDIGAVSIRSLVKIIEDEPQGEKKIHLPYTLVERQTVLAKK